MLYAIYAAKKIQKESAGPPGKSHSTVYAPVTLIYIYMQIAIKALRTCFTPKKPVVFLLATYVGLLVWSCLSFGPEDLVGGNALHSI